MIVKSLSLLVAAVAIVWALIQTNIVPMNVVPLDWLREIRHTGVSDVSPKPQTYVLSEDPVVVYVKDFISAQEAAHLVQLAYVQLSRF